MQWPKKEEKVKMKGLNLLRPKWKIYFSLSNIDFARAKLSEFLNSVGIN